MNSESILKLLKDKKKESPVKNKTQKAIDKKLEKERAKTEKLALKEREKLEKKEAKEREKAAIKEVKKLEKEKEKLLKAEKKKTEKKTIEGTTKTKKKRIVIMDEPKIILNPKPESLPKPKSPSKTESAPKAKLRLNEQLASLMAQLAVLMQKRGDNIRSRVYKRAEETIMSFNTDITSSDDLIGKPGIGPTIIEKVNEYLKTGTLQLIEREKNKPENILSEVYGVGPQKAKELVEKGIVSIEQLRERQNEVLNNVQKVGLKYYEDILEKIPRSEIDEYNEIFKEVFEAVSDSDSRYEIVGSYRRGALSSGDIDVIITSKTPEVFVRFLDLLVSKNIILEILSRGKSKCLVVAKIPSSSRARRVDFLYSTPEEYPFSILYFTGSKAFNTVMRGHSLKMGFSLNEHGISKIIDKKKEEKLTLGFKEEKDIFDFLNLQYKEPNERIDGRSVILKSGKEVEVLNVPSLKTNEPNTLVEDVQLPVIVKPVSPINLKKTKKIREPKQPKEPKNKSENKEKIPKDKKRKNIKILEDINKEEVFEMPKESKEKVTKKPETSEEEIKNLIEEFSNKGITVLEKLPESSLSEMIKLSSNYYYNTKTPLITDNEYDIIKEYIENKFPKNKAIAAIGAPVGKNKVKLPYEMASMDKIKPDTNALSNWMQDYKGPYVLSCKLDGVSGLYVTENGTEKLYTRGDGKIGQDISQLLSVLNLPKTTGYAVRGEFIIPKKVFDDKYKDVFANPRNLVSGIVNSKTLDEKSRDLHFVTYEVIHPTMKPSEQLSKLKELGHEVVQHKTVDELSNEMLSQLLLDWRSSYEYEIDGVIVTDDKIHTRVTGNPEHAFAFKMIISDQMAEAKVVDVIWTPSKNGLLKPRVRIEPIRLGGVTIEYATGFNGKFIEENKIGIGALIQIIRSGDVIPYIKSVSTPADKARMPDVPYIWSETHVDVLLENAAEDITVREKNVTTFFVTLEVDGLSSGNVKRLMNAGHDTVPKILKMSKQDFESVEGFKTKMAEKIHGSIKTKVEAASLLDIMVASNKLGKGLGEKKMRPIMEEYPTILTSSETPNQKIEMLKTLKGIGKENANEFVANIPVFLEFIKDCGLESKLSAKEVVVLEEPVIVPPENMEHPLYRKKIVMTKVRDKTIIDALGKFGATLEDSIKKDTFVLVVKSKDDKSNKMDFAVKNNIPIMTPEEFKAAYLHR